MPLHAGFTGLDLPRKVMMLSGRQKKDEKTGMELSVKTILSLLYQYAL